MALFLPPGPFRAYLFDCDGTIADSLPLHFQAWNLALGEWGGHFPKALFFSWSGIPVPKTVEMLNAKFGWSLPVEQVVRRREEAYFKMLPEVKPVPEVLAEIEAGFGRLPMAVVSGSPRASVEKTLGFLGLGNRFEAIVGGDDCERGKPFPDPYLLAAERLGVSPSDCLVFEDADLGVQAAAAAGMQFVRIPIRQF